MKRHKTIYINSLEGILYAGIMCSTFQPRNMLYGGPPTHIAQTEEDEEVTCKRCLKNSKV